MEESPKKKSWDNYWNSSNINREIMQVWAAYFLGAYEKFLGLNKHDVVLDFGAGYGNVSYFIRNKVKHIYMYDKAEYMQQVLTHNFSEHKNMQIVSDLNEINGKVSVIIVNSVSQYIPKDDFRNILKLFRKFCTKETNIIIADVIPRNYSKLNDFRNQLSISLKYGFFTKLLVYAISNTFFSPSLSLSAEYLIKYDEEEIIGLLTEEGFDAKTTENNFTFSKDRFTIHGKLAGSGQ
jgi:ubiquinone/menaquinone biosynthesis C-methylase UbiE